MARLCECSLHAPQRAHSLSLHKLSLRMNTGMAIKTFKDSRSLDSCLPHRNREQLYLPHTSIRSCDSYPTAMEHLPDTAMNNVAGTNKRSYDDDQPSQPTKRRRILPGNVPKEVPVAPHTNSESASKPAPKRVAEKPRNVKTAKKAPLAKAKKVTPPHADYNAVAQPEDARRRHEAAVSLLDLSQAFFTHDTARVLRKLLWTGAILAIFG